MFKHTVWVAWWSVWRLDAMGRVVLPAGEATDQILNSVCGTVFSTEFPAATATDQIWGGFRGTVFSPEFEGGIHDSDPLWSGGNFASVGNR